MWGGVMLWATWRRRSSHGRRGLRCGLFVHVPGKPVRASIKNDIHAISYKGAAFPWKRSFSGLISKNPECNASRGLNLLVLGFTVRAQFCTRSEPYHPERE